MGYKVKGNVCVSQFFALTLFATRCIQRLNYLHVVSFGQAKNAARQSHNDIGRKGDYITQKHRLGFRVNEGYRDEAESLIIDTVNYAKFSLNIPLALLGLNRHRSPFHFNSPKYDFNSKPALSYIWAWNN